MDWRYTRLLSAATPRGIALRDAVLEWFTAEFVSISDDVVLNFVFPPEDAVVDFGRRTIIVKSTPKWFNDSIAIGFIVSDRHIR